LEELEFYTDFSLLCVLSGSPNFQSRMSWLPRRGEATERDVHLSHVHLVSTLRILGAMHKHIYASSRRAVYLSAGAILALTYYTYINWVVMATVTRAVASSRADLVAETCEYLVIRALQVNHRALTGKLNSPNSLFVAENKAITR
jgi:hypothetical protein